MLDRLTNYDKTIEVNGKKYKLVEEEVAKNKYYFSDGSTSSKWDPFKQLHRVDGPAIEYNNGTKFWFLNGKYHREDGPAVKDSNGNKSWYLNGKYYTEKDYNNIIKEVNEMCLALQLTDPREWVRELGRKRRS